MIVSYLKGSQCNAKQKQIKSFLLTLRLHVPRTAIPGEEQPGVSWVKFGWIVT